jgi:hypothetical protein
MTIGEKRRLKQKLSAIASAHPGPSSLTNPLPVNAGVADGVVVCWSQEQITL